MGHPGQRLRQLRVARGLSQEELAGTEFRASYISRIESGQRRGSDAFWTAMARSLGTA